MKNLFALTALLVSTTVAGHSCTFKFNHKESFAQPSGSDTTIVFSVPGDYEKIEVSGAFAVIGSASAENVQVTVDSKIAKYIVVNCREKELEIKHNLRSFKKMKRSTVIIPVSSMPVRSIELSGASSFSSDTPFHSPEMSIELSGASKLTAEVNAVKLEVEASGASKVELSGRASYAELECSGASKISGNNAFEAEMVEVDLSGASKISEISAPRFKGNLSGASKLSVKDGADVSMVGKSGASKIVTENQ